MNPVDFSDDYRLLMVVYSTITFVLISLSRTTKLFMCSIYSSSSVLNGRKEVEFIVFCNDIGVMPGVS